MARLLRPHHFIKSFLDSLRPVFGVCTLNTSNSKKSFSFQLKTEFTIFHFFTQKKLNLPDKNFLYSSKIHIFLQKKILNTARGATRRPVRSPSGESRQCAPDGLSDDLEIRPAFSSPVLQLCLWSLPPKTIHQKPL